MNTSIPKHLECLREAEDRGRRQRLPVGRRWHLWDTVGDLVHWTRHTHP